jgi:hypothetical protein
MAVMVCYSRKANNFAAKQRGHVDVRRISLKIKRCVRPATIPEGREERQNDNDDETLICAVRSYS